MGLLGMHAVVYYGSPPGYVTFVKYYKMCDYTTAEGEYKCIMLMTQSAVTCHLEMSPRSVSG